MTRMNYLTSASATTSGGVGELDIHIEMGLLSSSTDYDFLILVLKNILHLKEKKFHSSYKTAEIRN